ncbi:ATP-grasp domain-containing protein [Pseudomonadota bacterium]
MTAQGKVLFVGAGPAQMPAIKHASELGYQPYSIDADPDAVGFQYSLAYEVGDIRDDQFIVTCAKQFDVDAIVCVATDVPVVAVARACTELGLHAIPVAAAEVSINKLKQRECLKAAGLNVPAFLPFSTVKEAWSCVDEIGFPVVIKPTDSAGSRGVRFVDGSDDVGEAAEGALEASRSCVGIVEGFVAGAEISVEGFVAGGEFYSICMSEKTRTQPPYLLDMDVKFPAQFSNVDQEDVLTVARDAVIACGFDSCPVHMEILVSSRGLFVVELAARGAGFRVFTNILPYVTSVDTVDVQLKLALGREVSINVAQPLKGAVISFVSPIPGELMSVSGVEQARAIPGVQEAEIYLKPGKKMGGLRCGADRIGHVITFGESRQIAEQQTNLALSLIKLDVE